MAGEDPIRIAIATSAGVDALYAPRRLPARPDAGGRRRRGGRGGPARRQGDRAAPRPPGRVTGVRAGRRHRRRDVGDARRTSSAPTASGRSSRRPAGPRLDRGRHASAVRYAYVRGLDVPGYEWWYGNGAAAGLIPTDDGRALRVRRHSPHRMRTLRLGRSEGGGFDAPVGLAAPDQLEPLAAAHRVGRHHGWAGATGFMRQPWGPGWALVGDAGYYKDPISSHGLTDAMRDAELGSRAILDGLGGRRRERAAFDGVPPDERRRVPAAVRRGRRRSRPTPGTPRRSSSCCAG